MIKLAVNEASYTTSNKEASNDEDIAGRESISVNFDTLKHFLATNPHLKMSNYKKLLLIEQIESEFKREFYNLKREYEFKVKEDLDKDYGIKHNSNTTSDSLEKLGTINTIFNSFFHEFYG